MTGPDLGERVGAGDRDRVGVPAFGKQTLPLGLADAELFGDVSVGIVSGADVGRSISIAHDVPA